MQIQFKSPGGAGWRRPGRPPREPSERAVNALRQTSKTRVAEIMLDENVTAEDLRQLRLDLKAAERKLGGRVHTQKRDGKFLFYWEPE